MFYRAVTIPLTCLEWTSWTLTSPRLHWTQSINQSIYQSINQSIDQSFNQSINQSINQPINHSINQSINQPTSQSIIQSINQSINQQINQPINQPTNQSTNQPTNQPTPKFLQEMSSTVQKMFNRVLKRPTYDKKMSPLTELRSNHWHNVVQCAILIVALIMLNILTAVLCF